ncbi:virulence factor TspB C-terminal domain-related protein [Acinetobacter johnsonii]|uniref:virulence factor TspB C-terminal domain-related protein n=1 Tax=Acinetobacter johnsonii TaxID=40214 RepID=UPI00247FF3C8|nr:virulence factor TspB C-terminal domain-related protein [Acinetobacter johnsonii]
MKKLWLCCFLILTSPVFAAERTDYRDWEKTRPQVVKKWDAQFEGVKKQIALTNNYANGSMRTVVDQINGQDKVRTQIRASGYDPDTGKKIRIEANVTQTANKAKVASTLTDRLGKAKNYAKNVGKASIPTFVGMAAFHGLMEGIGWVIDEGGEVKRLPTQEDPDPTSSPCSSSNENCSYAPTLFWIANYETLGTYSSELSAANAAWKGGRCAPYSPLVKGGDSFYRSGGDCIIGRPLSKSNPNYLSGTPSPTPDLIATPQQIETALKNALESNNPALAAAISEAIKAAYTPEGTIATIGDEQSNGLAVNAADTARDAVNKAANNTGSEPSSQGKPGYYKITDGDKTIEGNVYETDPTGSITPIPDTGTGTEPGTGTGTGTGTSTGGATLQLPAFCEWAGIVCDFIEWYKTEPEDDAPELPEHELEKKEIDKELLNVTGSSCPQDLTVNWTGLPFGITINESFEMQPYCNELEPLKYVFILITTCLCAFMFVRL